MARRVVRTFRLRARRDLGDGSSREPLRELAADLDVPKQKGALVESLPAQPARYFVVALTRIARAACRHDIVERVSTAARERQNTVSLHRRRRLAAVGAAAPRRLQCCPLIVGEVVVGAIHASLALLRCSCPARPVPGHRSSSQRERRAVISASSECEISPMNNERIARPNGRRGHRSSSTCCTSLVTVPSRPNS